LWVLAPGWVAAVPAGADRARALAGLRFAAVIAEGTALLGWATIQAPQGVSRLIGRAGFPALLLVEMITVGAFAETDPPTQSSGVHQAAIDFLKADTGWFRVDVDVAAINVWSPSLLLSEGFEMPQGTGNPMEIASYNQFYWSIPHKGSPAYRLLGAKYIIVPKDALPGGEGIWPAFLEDPWVDVHLNTRSLNRVWLVYDATPVTNREEAYAIVFSPEFAPDQSATIENGPALSTVGQGTLELLSYGPNRIRIKVGTTEPVLLVLSDILYPGWKATLDGQATHLYPTDGIFRGVVVPTGSHEITMTFFPSSLSFGMGLAGMALLALVCAVYLRRKTAASEVDGIMAEV
jgi:hypothetical protein